MPDPAKLAALEAAGYKVVRVCATCVHSRDGSSGTSFRGAWGTCALIPYDHAKHGRRFASIHAAGSCPRHELTQVVRLDLQRSGFDRFLP